MPVRRRAPSLARAAALGACILIGGSALADVQHAARMIGEILAALHIAELCHFDLSPERRRDLEDARGRFEREVGLPAADLKEVEDRAIGRIRATVCQGGPDGYARALGKVLDQIRHPAPG